MSKKPQPRLTIPVLKGLAQVARNWFTTLSIAPRRPISRTDFLRLSGGTVIAGLSNHAALAGPGPSLPASVAIVRSTINGAVLPGLAGLSYEKSKLSMSFFTAANANLIGCFRRLGTGLLRVGGNSVDKTIWTPNGAAATSGQVSPADVRALAAFLQSTGWQVIYGINLGTGTPAAAAAEAMYAANAFGTSLYGFEIGNECDQYVSKGIRSATYDLSDFIVEWSAYAAAIRQNVPNAPLTGPASAANFASWTVPFASSEAAEIKLLTQHYYRGNGASAASTMSLLLAADPSLLNELSQLQNVAASGRIPNRYRLTEANSFYGGGAPNISNAYGSALWAIDFLLINAQLGSAGVNFHGGGGASYSPIDDTGTAVLEVMPVYYGMLFVDQIAPSPMYGVGVSTSLLLTAYAVAGADGATYLAIVNKDAANTAVTAIDLGASGSSATPLVLSGSALSALTGTTLGGAAIAPDGTWSPSPGQPIAVSGTALTVDVAPASAVLLKIT